MYVLSNGQYNITIKNKAKKTLIMSIQARNFLVKINKRDKKLKNRSYFSKKSTYFWRSNFYNTLIPKFDENWSSTS